MPFSASRRAFLSQAGTAATGALLAPALLTGCAAEAPLAHIAGQMHGPNAALGHLLRGPADRLPAPTHTIETEVLIIGGGVAGLSARRWLQQQGQADVLLVELDEAVGGNAAAGRNPVSAYPWGAHYLPVPDVRNHELLHFLEQAGTLTGYAPGGLPIYSDYHLCHAPEERLSINGHWQDGLVPSLGLSAADAGQVARFFELMETLKARQGNDGRDAFRIPLDQASADPQYRQLDQISFADYLTREGFTAPALRWYLDYCCRDDYGATAAQVSAWAGLHYFASRKGRAHNASAADVLTWPEGNHFLTEQLKQQASGPILTNTVAYDLRETGSGMEALAYNGQSRSSTRIRARQVLLATPAHVSRRLLAGLPGHSLPPAEAFHHAPWLIANLTVAALPQGPGRPLSWDNVRYGSASLGYINATQQSLSQDANGPKVITLYWPLTDEPPATARQRAYQTTYVQWLPRVVAELETFHPGVTPHIQRADLWLWGHGMAAPGPGFVWGPARQDALRPIRNRVFFAHTDLSGISIFEEGFYQGIRAAREMLADRPNPNHA